MKTRRLHRHRRPLRHPACRYPRPPPPSRPCGATRSTCWSTCTLDECSPVVFETTRHRSACLAGSRRKRCSAPVTTDFTMLAPADAPRQRWLPGLRFRGPAPVPDYLDRAQAHPQAPASCTSKSSARRWLYGDQDDQAAAHPLDRQDRRWPATASTASSTLATRSFRDLFKVKADSRPEHRPHAGQRARICRASSRP